jgi:hypothetical protein
MAFTLAKQWRRFAAVGALTLATAAGVMAAAVPAQAASTALSDRDDHRSAGLTPFGIRTGVHPGFERLVFDLKHPTAIDLNASSDGRSWTLRLPDHVSPPTPHQLRALYRLPNISAATISATEIGHVLELAFRRPTLLTRGFALTPDASGGHRQVFDFAPAASRQALSALLPYLMPAAGGRVAAEPSELAATDAPLQSASLETAAADEFLLASPPAYDDALSKPSPSASPDGPIRISGFVELEGRWFPQASAEGPRDRLVGSIAVEPTLEAVWARGDQRLRLTAFGRLDTVTGQRTHADLREAKWVGVFGALEATIGLDRRFWGVTESVHLVDVINQYDTLEDVDREDKLGQPMLSLAWTTPYGTFSGFFLPYFREQRFPGRDDRPAAPLPVDRDRAVLPGGNHWRTDWALRWKHVLGPADIGVSYFSGVGRDPLFRPDVSATGSPVLVPVYQTIDQLGLDAQLTVGSLLLKLEALKQWNPTRDYAAFVAGFEYTFAGITSAGADLGVLAEYLYDERGRAGPSAFNNDLFVGLRYSGNDTASSELLVGAVVDLNGAGTAVNLEAARRLGAHWRLSVDARLFFNVNATDPLAILRDDDFVQFKLQYHF